MTTRQNFCERLPPPTRHLSVRSGHGTGKINDCELGDAMVFASQVSVQSCCDGPYLIAAIRRDVCQLKRWIGGIAQRFQELANVKSDRVELVAAPAEAFISVGRRELRTQGSLAGVLR